MIGYEQEAGDLRWLVGAPGGVFLSTTTGFCGRPPNTCCGQDGYVIAEGARLGHSV